MEKQLTLLQTDQPVQKKIITVKPILIFVDGASRYNPGPSGAGVYITHNDQILCKEGYYLGKKTNNQAEYLALLLALFITNNKLANLEKPHPPLIITSDSELLVKQINGLYKVKNPELHTIKKIIDLLLHDKTYTIQHVLRKENTVADKLANLGIDKKKKLPASFITLLADNEISI